MLERLYQWTLEKAAHPHAVWYLMAFAFAEATFFPIPADVLLVPMVIAARHRAWILSIACALASSTGGMVGWLIGFYAFESIGQPIIDFYGLTDQVEKLAQQYRELGNWIVAVGAISPIPYKLVTITSGFFQMDFWEYNLTSYSTRMVRFLAVGAVLYWTGPWVKNFMDKRLKLFTTIVMVLLVGGFVAVFYVL